MMCSKGDRLFINCQWLQAGNIQIQSDVTWRLSIISQRTYVSINNFGKDEIILFHVHWLYNSALERSPETPVPLSLSSPFKGTAIDLCTMCLYVSRFLRVVSFRQATSNVYGRRNEYCPDQKVIHRCPLYQTANRLTLLCRASVSSTLRSGVMSDIQPRSDDVITGQPEFSQA